MGKISLKISPPSEKQKLFLLSDAPYTAFGGARGGGKSWAVRVKALLLALSYPGIKIMIIRKTKGELWSNHIRELIRMTAGMASYHETKSELRFPSGSIISFHYLRNASDLERFQGIEADVVFIDEATQFPAEAFERIKASVRGVNDMPKRIYLTCNPGGVGHGWVKRLFIDKVVPEGHHKGDYKFIKSLVTDNAALLKKDPDYLRQLKSLPPKLRRAWLDGEWDIFEGQFFEEFRDDPDHYGDRINTHVIAPFEVPRDWKIYRSFDFGYSRPFSCDWWAVDYDGRAYLILQLYGATEPNVGVRWTPERIFSEIARLEREHRWLKGKQILGVADPSIWDASRGEAIIECADRHFVHFQPGDNKRLPGWMQCHLRLQFDSDGRPMVYFFNTCKDAIRTLPLLSYSETSPEDLDTTAEDHFADSFRYFAMSRPISPKIEKEGEMILSDPLDLTRKKYGRYSY